MKIRIVLTDENLGLTFDPDLEDTLATHPLAPISLQYLTPQAEIERLLDSYMEATASAKRLLANEEVVELVSDLENTRDPEILVDVLHVDEHAQRVDDIKATVRHAYSSACSLKNSFFPLWWARHT